MARLGLALMWLLRLLPGSMLAALGNVFGRVLYVLARERRTVCRINLERCFADLSPAERDLIARRHFACFARSLLDRGVLWWSSRAAIVKRIDVVGLEHLRTAMAEGPVILFAPHFVGLDAGWTRLTCELDLASVYANQKSRAMNDALYNGRMRFGEQQLFSRQEGIRPALAALKAGVPFYYLPDMDYGPRDALFVPFFGVPAATITGLSRLASLAGRGGAARVVPCVTRMLPGGHYELRCHPAWDNYPGQDIEADTRRMNEFIEQRVREMPEQYLWTHKRFKTRPAGEAKWY